MTPFDSSAALHARFTDGLRQLLEHGLGAYILVLANASFDTDLFAKLQPDLARGFAAQCAALKAAPRDSLPPDDVAVFAQLQSLGLAQVETAQWRDIDGWEAQYNQLRAMRPPRNAHAVISQVYQAFEPTGFHFNKPFLRQESIWVGELLGRQIDLLYNKFPFIDLHGLLVPERESLLPQYLSLALHRYIWQLCEALPLPGWGLGYNAYGAYSSVNHFHVQSFVRQRPLPVENPEWRHNGGSRDYPVNCQVFTESHRAYDYISELHAANMTYNLLYRPGRVYCLPRRFQGSYQHAAWTGGFAWYEMCGGMTISSGSDFQTMNASAIEAEFAKLKIADL